MAYNYRGRRVAYDNIAVGAAAGKENVFSQSTVQDNVAAVTDVSLYNVQEVSVQGNAYETGSISNIAVGVSYGLEDTENAGADKLTSDSEDVADAG